MNASKVLRRGFLRFQHHETFLMMCCFVAKFEPFPGKPGSSSFERSVWVSSDGRGLIQKEYPVREFAHRKSNVRANGKSLHEWWQSYVCETASSTTAWKGTTDVSGVSNKVTVHRCLFEFACTIEVSDCCITLYYLLYSSIYRRRSAWVTLRDRGECPGSGGVGMCSEVWVEGGAFQVEISERGDDRHDARWWRS